jgi:hypothetical protein
MELLRRLRGTAGFFETQFENHYSRSYITCKVTSTKKVFICLKSIVNCGQSVPITLQ